MFKKTCINCDSPSYGSSNDQWICPFCETDLTEVPSEELDVGTIELEEFLKLG